MISEWTSQQYTAIHATFNQGGRVSEGAGTGFERGAPSISKSVMSGIRLGLRQKRNEQLDDLYKQAIDYTRTTWHSPYSAPISVTLQPELVGDRR